MQTVLKGKHFLCEQDWTNEELETLFEVAKRLKMDYALDIPHEICKNKSLFMLFFEESTRTRNAFECGVTQLGGHGNYLTPKATQIDHGETPKDTIEVLDLYTYRIGLENMDYSYGVAISILKSLVSISLVVLANMVAKRIRGNTVI